MTWDELIASATQTLISAGIDDARTNAEYLATHVRGLSRRSELRLKLREAVELDQAAAFTAVLNRRLQREPLQYILGEWEFFGLPMIVRRGVLIPRPETEILVEEALKEASLMTPGITIVDAGTGSGAIALALASRLQNAQVFGHEVSAEAIEIAQENKTRLNLRNVQFEMGDMMDKDWLESKCGAVNLLVSNPPYVSRSDFETLEPELRLYEPREALTDGSSGYTFYERLAAHATRLLAPKGRLLVELGFGMADPVAEIVRSAGLHVLRVVPDLAGIPRVLVAVRTQETSD